MFKIWRSIRFSELISCVYFDCRSIRGPIYQIFNISRLAWMNVLVKLNVYIAAGIRNARKTRKLEVNVPVSVCPQRYSSCLTLNKSINNHRWPVTGKLEEKWNQLTSGTFASYAYNYSRPMNKWPTRWRRRIFIEKETIYDRLQWTL